MIEYLFVPILKTRNELHDLKFVNYIFEMPYIKEGLQSMKKILYFLMIILTMSLSLAGCSKDDAATENQVSEDAASEDAISGETTSEDSEAEQVDTSKLLSNPYVELLKSGRYVLKFRGVVDLDPEDIFSDVTIAREGENSLWIIQAEGSKSHIITKGDTAFMVDDESHSYITGTMSNMETSMINGESLKFSSEGEEIIDGRTMKYEEYSYDIGKLKFFFDTEDDKKLHAVLNTNPVETVMMEITEFSENVTPDMFEVPEGYSGI